MSFESITILAIICASAASDENQAQPASNGQFPYVAFIRIRTGARFFVACTGTLLTKRYVLTAARCLARQPQPKPKAVRVYMGAANRAQCRWRAVNAVLPHPCYLHGNYAYRTLYDVGLLELKTAFEPVGNVGLVRLVTWDNPHVAGGWANEDIVTVGYGIAGDAGGNATEAQRYGRGRVRRSAPGQWFLHVEALDGAACSGDAGAPLLLRHGSVYLQIGVLSGRGAEEIGDGDGMRCTGGNYEDKYARVDYLRIWLYRVADYGGSVRDDRCLLYDLKEKYVGGVAMPLKPAVAAAANSATDVEGCVLSLAMLHVWTLLHIM